MNIKKYFFSILTMFCAIVYANNWMESSNQISIDFSKDWATKFPEVGSDLGYEEFDKLGTIPSVNNKKIQFDHWEKWEHILVERLKKEKDRNLKIDISLLLNYIKMSREEEILKEKYKIIDLPEPSLDLFSTFKTLVNDQTPKERKKSAVDRFKFYMRPFQGENYIQASKTVYLDEKNRFGKQAIMPFKEEVELYIENSSAYVSGLKSLLESSGRTDWLVEYEQYTREIKLFDDFVKTEILPFARSMSQLPLEFYLHDLKKYGIDVAPQDLIKQGKSDFEKIFTQYELLAKKIAEKNKLKNDLPHEVIKFLKRDMVVRAKDVEKLYHEVDKKITSIITEHEIITLPKKPVKMRVANEAESKAIPVPHVIPPPLMSKSSSVAEIVIPSTESGQLSFDDFSHRSAALLLMAHEGRPGHELQFSRMQETGVSQIRSLYAFTPVNMEGWGLYAESLLYPYVSDEEKFSGLFALLVRISRYFLDPQLRLGEINESDIYKVLVDRIGVSKEFAKLEYERYAFRLPGQAPSYYHGLLKINQLKAKITELVGEVTTKCFHDTLISFGILPHEEILKFIKEFEKCKKK